MSTLGIRVLLVDDHAVLRAGIRRLIEDEEDFEVVGEAATGQEAIDAAARVKPDVTVMDLTMPELDGVEATRAILAAQPGALVLVLTMHDEPAFVERVLKAGAAGYLLKRAADTELIRALRAVCKGDGYVDPGVTRPLISELVHSRTGRPPGRDLSHREEEVLSLVAWGYTTREIAQRLVISPKTVESHRARVMEKLNLRSRAELVRHAKDVGILDSAPD